METIRNYLESMFKNLPHSDAVLKAKYELGQMMEDKYTELIKDGKSENEAVGTVIAEFGNLEELAKDLGIADIYQTNKNVIRRKLSMDEVKRYLQLCKKQAYMIAFGVALCISCVTGPILCDAFGVKGYAGPLLMFMMIGGGVALFIVAGTIMDDFNFMQREPCSVELTYLESVKNSKRDFMSTYSILIAVGVLLCVFCVMPSIILGDSSVEFLEELSGAMLFWFVSAGVFLMIFAKKVKQSYEKILSLNNEKTNMNAFSFGQTASSDNANYCGNSSDKKNPKITNKTVRLILSVYWPTVTCVYLIVSFLTFKWGFTWIIWPVAGVVEALLKNIFSDEEAKNEY